MMTMRSKRPALAGALALSLAACGTCQPGASPTAGLAGTSWRLVSFQSSSDKVGEIRPANADQYTLSFSDDNRVSMRVDCNRGAGTWQAEPSGPAGGSLRIGAAAITRMMCPSQPLSDRLPQDFEHVRSYMIKDGKLYLNLMADGGAYQWERVNP